MCQNSEDTVAAADECLTVDLHDSTALSALVKNVNPHYVVHLAAISFVAHKDVSEIYQVNLVGTLNLLTALATDASRLKRVLLVSSANIYGTTTELPITEELMPRPANHYGISKYAMENAALLYSDLPLVIVRPFNYTGVGQSENFLVPKIVSAFKRNETSIDLGNLDVARDFSDVRDVVTAYLALLISRDTEKIYNICSGASTSILSIIHQLNTLAGYNIQTVTNPDSVRTDDIKELYGSNARLKQAIGEYRNFDIGATLNWMYSS